jgi:Na+/melibiose symporter-like transporter
MHGYVANAVPESAEDQMRLLIGLLPAALCIVGIAVISLYNLTPGTLTRLQAQVMTRMPDEAKKA